MFGSSTRRTTLSTNLSPYVRGLFSFKRAHGRFGVLVLPFSGSPAFLVRAVEILGGLLGKVDPDLFARRLRRRPDVDGNGDGGHRSSHERCEQHASLLLLPQHSKKLSIFRKFFFLSSLLHFPLGPPDVIDFHHHHHHCPALARPKSCCWGA